MKKTTAFLTCLPVGFLACNHSTEKPEKKEHLPNIVFILADDLGYGDLSCYGAKDISTPNIDKIAAQGIRFSNFYSASSVSSPSRAALLTGRLPQRMGINAVFFPESFTGMPQSEITIAEMLKQKGYATGIVGKWHLGHREEFLPLQQGFDFYFGIPYSNDMASLVYMRGNKVESFGVDQHFLTKTYTNEALQYIENVKDKPFFLYLAHNMPHVPVYVSKDFAGTSKRGLYGDAVQELDWSVGEIIKKLQQLEILDNTLIVFSSDNGPWVVMKELGGSTGGLREGKMFTFEGGMRIPAVAMWKNKISGGQEQSGVFSHLDWFRTFLHMADVEPVDSVALDGKDIFSQLISKQNDSDSTMLYLDFGELQCYRKGKWKVKLPYEGFPGARWKQAVAPHDTLLFDLDTDPYERNNLYKEQRVLAIELIQEMYDKYSAMGKLPPSLEVRAEADESHYRFPDSKKD